MAKKRSKKQTYEDSLLEVEEMNEAQKEKDRGSALTYKVSGKCKNAKQKKLLKTIKENRITFVKGAAGTGKTFIALRAGLELLKNPDSPIGEILLTTPIVEVASSRNIGILPGDLDAKINYYFESFYDNIDKLIGVNARRKLKQFEYITDKVVSFIRGATFGKYDKEGNPIGSFCIADEFQNMNVMEFKTYISRLGENSKMVILGDTDQIDIKLKTNEKDSISDGIERLGDLDGVGVVEFTEDEIVRDPFLIKIMKRYKNS